MNKYKEEIIVVKVTLIMFFMLLAACTEADNKNSSAPGSLSGKTIKRTITAGTGLFANKGTSTIKVSSNSNTYIKTDAGNNVADSVGTYTYTSSGDTGVFSMKDSSLSFATCLFIYNKKTSGTFKCTVASDVKAKQSGTFVEI